jgi:hypothetical protein
MTVIAYRKGVMAGDSCWSEKDGFICNVQNKLVRLASGAIYGGAGATDDRALRKLLQNVVSPDRLPDLATLSDPDYGDVECLLVLPDHSVWTIGGGEKGYGVCPVKVSYCAIGSGRDLAIGAMAQGATAAAAVKLACQWHVHCRPPVHTLKLKG